MRNILMLIASVLIFTANAQAQLSDGTWTYKGDAQLLLAISDDRVEVLGIIDVGDLPDGIIDVGDLPGGIIDVGDLPDGIIDVGWPDMVLGIISCDTTTTAMRGKEDLAMGIISCDTTTTALRKMFVQDDSRPDFP